ncbi:MAG TPA: hypothetical protein VK421_07150 [Pyrinomonadaceae bacterium]|nr:hypothetical protein [Pyrinomonadaceae bacterium]
MKKLSLSTVAALLALAVGGGAAQSRVAAQNKGALQFIAGVLRADGALVPFAEYRHGLWWNPWPEPPQQSGGGDEPQTKSLGGHPEPWFQQCGKSPTTWYVRPRADSVLTLKTSGTVEIGNHSQTNWALVTDYPQKREAEKNAHHENAGLALNVDLQIDGMIEIEPGGEEARSVLAYVKSAFDHSEAAEARRLAAEPGPSHMGAAEWFPQSSERRARVALTATKLYRDRSGIDGAHVYYVEVEKRYEKPRGSRDGSCEGVAFLAGWVLKRKDGVIGMLDDSFGLTDCDGKERGNSVELFGVLRADGRTFLLTVEHGWEDESYIIYELKDFALTRLLVTFGG